MISLSSCSLKDYKGMEKCKCAPLSSRLREVEAATPGCRAEIARHANSEHIAAFHVDDRLRAKSTNWSLRKYVNGVLELARAKTCSMQKP